jgi:hypothetical protein
MISLNPHQKVMSFFFIKISAVLRKLTVVVKIYFISSQWVTQKVTGLHKTYIFMS